MRPVRDYAAGHIPGALSIPLRDQFATWLGWLLPPETPVVIVRNPDQDPADIVWPALAIGFEQIRGELAGGVAAWTADGGVLRHNRLLGPDQIDAGSVVDVRQDSEFEAAHIPGARHVELGDLLARRGRVADGADGRDVRTRRTRRRPRRACSSGPVTRTSRSWSADPTTGPPRPATPWPTVDELHPRRRGRSASAFAPTCRSSLCWSRSTPSSAA